MFYKFIVLGRPVPAQRMTQGSKWSKRARKSLEYQEQVAWEAKAAGIPCTDREVKLTVRFYFNNKKHGDLSNLIKSIEDGLQYGGIFKNDKQVRWYGDGTGIYYDNTPRAEILIQKMDSVSFESVNLCSRCGFAGSEDCKPRCDISKAYELGKAILEGER